MMDTECITLSDDDEVEFIEQIYNLEPTCVDLTEEDDINNTFRQSQSPPSPSQQTPPYQQTPLSQQPPLSQQQPPPSQQQPPFQSQPLFQSKPLFQSQPPNNLQPFKRSTEPPKPEPSPNIFFKRTYQRTYQPTQTFQSNQNPQQTSEGSQKFSRKPSPTPSPPPPTPSSLPQHSQQPLRTQNGSTNQDTIIPTPPTPPPPEEQQPRPQVQMSDRDLMMSQKALGNEKYKSNQFDEAIRIYKRCTEIAKRLCDTEMSAILHFNLAMSYCNLRSYDQAADECSKAVKLDDNYIKAHLKRAEIYQRQFKFEEAVICYEHICELDRTNNEYQTLLNKAKEAAKHTQKKDYFAILGLKTNCTKQDLKKAYRQSALKHHPDRHSNADIVTRRIEEKHFKDASEAHTFIQKRFSNY